MKVLTFFCIALFCTGCVSMGDDAAFLEGKLSINDASKYNKCILNVFISSNGFHLLEEEISKDFQVSFSVSPQGSEYNVRIDCKSIDDKPSQLFSKKLKLGGGISSVNI